ncbi:TPA: hypothetical protein DIV55_05650 [Patescibacteria group bacterium]|uniref:Uncharacterized protein n=1 Tax=Candidatus Gottesmanbacteria bacterium GW2011_GWA1_43_11 TaxID=1618436 RepID=A0A0G1CIK4_9BACT|nr:MAG: hypothetical protein UV59_C0006G0076 [Candidatus Gottesmanbacteria bacterium GW2011_GWA1_43_11]HCS79193.1 hypothetical protein [Patescibacteria group bacterium]
MAVDKNALIKKIEAATDLKSLRDLATMLEVNDALDKNIVTTQKKLVDVITAMDEAALESKLRSKVARQPQSAAPEIDYAKLAAEMLRIQTETEAVRTPTATVVPPKPEDTQPIKLEQQKVVEDTQPVQSVESEEPENEIVRIWKKYWRWFVAAGLAIIAFLGLVAMLVATVTQSYGWAFLLLVCPFVPATAGAVVVILWPKKKSEVKS